MNTVLVHNHTCTYLQFSKLATYRSRRQQVAENETQQVKEEEDEYGTRSKLSLLDQHSDLKKKAEGMCNTE